jgi:hypothetical protein
MYLVLFADVPDVPCFIPDVTDVPCFIPDVTVLFLMWLIAPPAALCRAPFRVERARAAHPRPASHRRPAQLPAAAAVTAAPLPATHCHAATATRGVPRRATGA